MKALHVKRKPALTLHEAAQKGLLEDVDCLLRTGENQLNELDMISYTPLQLAAEQGHLRVVILLLDKGAKAYIASHRMPSALHLASLNGHIAVVRELAKRFPHFIDMLSNENETPLYCAASKGYTEVMEVLLNGGAKVFIRGRISLISVAIQKNYPEVLALLLEKYLDIRAYRTNYGIHDHWTHVAVRLTRPQMLELLIQYGDAYELPDITEQTPLDLAVLKGDKECIEVLSIVRKKVDPSPLHESVFDEKLDDAIRLIAEGANLEAKDGFGWTPLDYAIDRSLEKFIDLFLEQGALIRRKRYRHKPWPIFFAKKGFAKALRLAIASHPNSDLNIMHKGRSALHCAAQFGRVATIIQLLSAGVEVDARDQYGRTPLHRAVMSSHKEAVQSLLLGGATIDFCDSYGLTPLHYAVQLGNITIVTLLLKKGAQKEKRDAGGKTYLHLASESDKLEIAMLLLDAGLKPSDVDSDGYTVLMLAALAGSLRVCCFLAVEYPHEIDRLHAKTNRTAFLCALEAESIEVCKALANAGAQVAEFDNKGESYLMHALSEKNLEITDFFLARGMSMTLINNYGRNALSAAAFNNDKAIVHLVIHYAFLRAQKNSVVLLLCLKKNSQEQGAQLAETVENLLYRKRKLLLMPYLRHLISVQLEYLRDLLMHNDLQGKRADNWLKLPILDPDNFNQTKKHFLSEHGVPLLVARNYAN